MLTLPAFGLAPFRHRYAELLASLIQTAEQALWKREWAARDNGLAVPECVTRRQAVVNQTRSLLENNTHEND